MAAPKDDSKEDSIKKKDNLSLKHEMTDEDYKRFFYDFEDGNFKKKRLIGNQDPSSRLRTPCIKIQNPNLRHRNLPAYAVSYLAAYGPIQESSDDEVQHISHLCADEKKPKSNSKHDVNHESQPAACINYLHMRLHPIAENNKRQKDHRKLVKEKHRRQFKEKGQNNPIFYLRESDDFVDSADEEMEEVSFINRHKFHTFNRGLFWFDPTQRLQSKLTSLGFQLQDIPQSME